MSIKTNVAGILLIAAVAVAQDDSNAVAAAAQNGDIATGSVAQKGNNAAATGSSVMDDAEIAAKVNDLQKHVVIASFSARVSQNKRTGEKARAFLIRTEQDKDDPFVGTMRFTVEVLDGTNVWCGQKQAVQAKKKLLSATERKAEEKAKEQRKKSRGKNKKDGKGKKAKAAEIEAAETEAVQTEVAEIKAAETEDVETEAVETEVAKIKASEIDYAGEDTWRLNLLMGKNQNFVRPQVTACAVEYGFVVHRKLASGAVVSNQFVAVVSRYNKVVSADEIMTRNQGSPNVIKEKMRGNALRQGEGDGEEGEGDGGGGDGDGEGGGKGGGKNK